MYDLRKIYKQKLPRINMKITGRKDGLSPVVASVLLIALVLILASIVFLWARGFIGEQIEKGDIPVADLCDEIIFSVDLIPDSLVEGKYEAEIVNRGNYAIYSFMVVKTREGSELREEFAFPIDSQSSLNKTVDLRIDGHPPENVVFYPSLLGSVVGDSSNRPYTCVDNGQEPEI
jgi:hypothetical protein